MTRREHTLAAHDPTVTDGRVRLLLGLAGLAMLITGTLSYLAFAPADRSLVRVGSFVAIPTLIIALYAATRGRVGILLYLIVALLDLEAMLIGELPVEGMSVAVAIPLIGVAFLTYVLPAHALRIPYVAAWLSSTIGVTAGVLTWVDPHQLIVPAWTVVPTFAAVDAAGLLVLWQVNARRTAALRAISAAEARFRELLDGVDLVAIDVDRTGRLTFANKYAAQLFGWNREELIGLDWYDTFVPEYRREEARTRLVRIAQGTETMPPRRESEIETRSGDLRLLRWSHAARHGEDGKFASMASIAEDVTAVRQAEAAFRRVSELNNALIASSPVPTLVFGLDGSVQLWNPAIADLLGWPVDEVLGRPISEIIPTNADPEAITARFSEVAEGLEIRGASFSMVTRDGRPIRAQVYATALCDGDGAAYAIAAQVIDVTAQEAMEAKLRESQKMEAVGRLAGGVAHDFNNSLTAIGGFASLIAGSTDDAEIRQHAENISASVRRSANLTRELLAYARRSFLQPQAVELDALVDAVRPMLLRLLGEDVHLVVESGTAGATVRVDPGQFEQALLNLAVNARDAMPAGGRITIRTARVGDGASDPAGGAATWVSITVTDTGTGISPEVQSQVFDPFFTTKPVGIGTGLGLAMVQGFVVQSGGEVKLTSDPGRGTTVEIRLPEVASTRSEARPEVESPAAVRSGDTILFVEDEPAVAAVGFQILSRRGYRVLLADSGEAALALLRAHHGRIALILSDVILPDMRGPQVAKAARELHPEAAVLYASGYSADTFIERGEMIEGVDLIQKPYSAEQLAARARRAIDQHRERDLASSGAAAGESEPAA